MENPHTYQCSPRTLALLIIAIRDEKTIIRAKALLEELPIFEEPSFIRLDGVSLQVYRKSTLQEYLKDGIDTKVLFHQPLELEGLYQFLEFRIDSGERILAKSED